MKHGRYPFIIGFLIVPLAIYGTFVVAAYLQAFQLSFTNWRGFSPDVSYIGFDNFTKLFADSTFWKAIQHHALLLVFLPLLHGRWRALAVALAVASTLAIGLARITLGVHYLSDVLAGYLLGAAWVAAMIAVFNAWRRDSGRPAVDPAHGLEAHHASRLGGAAPLRRDPPG
jgi:ABC-type sugar transport system permease subunit